jgi:hypothetical protein
VVLPYPGCGALIDDARPIIHRWPVRLFPFSAEWLSLQAAIYQADQRIAQHLEAHDVLDQPALASHQSIQTLDTTGLRLSREVVLRAGNSGASRCVGMDDHRAPSELRYPIMT